MKKILLKDYQTNSGVFIDVSTVNTNIVPGGKHINYEQLIVNHRELLDKKQKYYIYCNGGVKAKKAANILEFYGYDVTLVYKE